MGILDAPAKVYAATEAPPSLPAGTVLPHRYDPQRQTYNLTPDTMRKWNAALARMKTGGSVARMSVVGHSVVVGSVAPAPRHQYSFATKIRDAFNAKYGSAGTGIVYLVTTSISDDTRIGFTGTWTAALGTRGAFNAACYNATGTGNTITFTPEIPVDSFNVYYAKNTASGTFSASIDGGTASTANANASGTESIGVLTIPATALGTHTLTITPPSAAAVYILAVEGTVGSSGVRVSRAGRSGATVSTITSSGTTGVDSLATIFQSAPDLTVIMCQINDYLNAVTVPTYVANLTTLVQKAQLTGDVLVIADQNVQTQPNTSSVLQSAYHAALYGLANTLGFAVLDIAARWKDYTTAVAVPPGFMATSGVDATGVHPYIVGHQDIANAVVAAVTGSNPPLSAVATSGAYADLSGKPVLAAGTNVTLSVSGTTTTISASGTGGGATVLPTGAQQQGFTLSAYDPILANTGTTLGGGTHCLLMRCVATASTTITNLYVGVGTAGAGATTTAGQTPQAGIYSVTGTQLAVTGDIGSILTGTTGMKALPLTSGLAVTAGTEYYLGIFWSGTTAPLLQRVASNTIMYQAGVNGIAANGRFADIQGGTTLPASINPAALTAAGVAYWIGGA